MTTLNNLRKSYYKQVKAIVRKESPSFVWIDGTKFTASSLPSLIKASVGVIPRGNAYRRLLDVEYPMRRICEK